MKKKLQLYGQERGVEVDVDATVGAIIGVNLFDQNGELYVPPDAGVPEDEYPITFWRLIQEIPPNVTALEEATGTGLFAVTGDGTGAFREIRSTTLAVSNGDGVAGDPTVDLAELPSSATGTLQGITRDAYGRVSGTTDATITGTAGQIEVANGDAAAGPPTLSLADVADAGGGTLQRTAFDAKGRKTGTSAATTDDLSEGAANLYFTDARADARIALQKGAANGLATLDADAKLQANQLPALAITETFVVVNEAAMLALDAQQGDVAVRTDQEKSYILTAEPASTLGNWQELLTPTGTSGTVTAVDVAVPTGFASSGGPVTSSGTITVTYDAGYQGYTSAEASKLAGIEAGAEANAVDSVNGQTGAVSLDASDVGAATSAQGALADTAVQPGDLAAVATTGDYGDLLNKPTLGTAAAADVGDFATAAQGTAADSAVQPGDLATVATSGAYSDLSGLPTLGTAAAANVGDFDAAGSAAAAQSAAQTYADGKVVSTISDGDTTHAPSGDAVYDEIATLTSAVTAALALKADDSSVVHKTGNENVDGEKTFLKSIRVATGASSGQVSVSSIPGQISDFTLESNGVPRWVLRCQNDVESGGNTGSTFSLRSRDDSGEQLNTIFAVDRATGVLNFGGPTPTVGGDEIAAIAQTITNGDTTHAPSGDAVSDALALKANASQFADGVYTPSSLASTNTTAVSPSSSLYSRNGNMVTVAFVVSITPAGAGVTTATLSLPIASNIGSSADAAGMVGNAFGPIGDVYGNASPDGFNVRFFATNTTPQTLRGTLLYRII